MPLQILPKILLQLENRTLKIRIAPDEVRNQDIENGAYHSTYEIFYQMAGGMLNPTSLTSKSKSVKPPELDRSVQPVGPKLGRWRRANSHRANAKSAPTPFVHASSASRLPSWWARGQGAR